MTHKEFSARGGKARARKLSKARRKEIASTAAKKRWKTHRRGSARAQESNEKAEVRRASNRRSQPETKKQENEHGS